MDPMLLQLALMDSRINDDIRRPYIHLAAAEAARRSQSVNVDALFIFITTAMLPFDSSRLCPCLATSRQVVTISSSGQWLE
ncbi:hypothetical protein TYRP_019659 [Tyrophagus putrescentiae]|nr:hypothetical protein TYRP_019659 [Tyrophagus putrescentiae]